MKELFCTYFDIHYLPQGLALYRSLLRHAGDFELWVVCMDDAVESALRSFNFHEVKLLRLQEIETESLLAVKPQRSWAEYCWTLTPRVITVVLDRAVGNSRVTYLDADIFLFADPGALFHELDQSGKDVLITEHDYSEDLLRYREAGIYCVQFVTFANTGNGREVLSWWAERCLEWCYDRVEGDKYGDQKYLDKWPTLFPHAVHVLHARMLALGPWNALRYITAIESGRLPVFYHFHSLRIFSSWNVRLWFRYRLPDVMMQLYAEYTGALYWAKTKMEAHGIAMIPTRKSWKLKECIIRLMAAQRSKVRWLRLH